MFTFKSDCTSLWSMRVCFTLHVGGLHKKNVLQQICLYPRASHIIEPRSEKTGLRGFRPGLTQTELYNHTR